MNELTQQVVKKKNNLQRSYRHAARFRTYSQPN